MDIHLLQPLYVRHTILQVWQALAQTSGPEGVLPDIFLIPFLFFFTLFIIFSVTQHPQCSTTLADRGIKALNILFLTARRFWGGNL